MMALIKQWFAPPVFEGDEEKTRRARLLNATLAVILVYLILVIFAELIDGRIPTSVILLNGVAILLLLMLQCLLQRGKVNSVGGGLSILAFIWVTLVSINLGTIRNPTTAAYVFVVILAGVLFDWRGILVSTIASSLAILCLILAENAGLLVQPDYTVTLIQWFTYTGLFGITGGMVYFTLETTQTALARARNELIERRYTETALKESQTRLQALADSTIQSFMLMNRDGRVSFYNRAAAQNASILLGLDIKEGDPKTKFIIKETSVGFHENFQKALTGKVITSENSLRTPNGMEIWLSFTYTPVHDEDGSVSGVCLNVINITERKQTEEKIRQQNEYLSNLHQISLDLLSRQKTQTLLNNIVHNAMSLVHAHHGYIFLPDGDYLHLSAATPGFAHHIGRRETQPGEGVLGQVWNRREIIVVENYSEWEFRDPRYEKDGLRAIAGIPIKRENEIIGVLEVVNTNSPRTFSDEELEILTRFATLAALVLNNAQLLDSTESEIAERKRNEAVLQKQVNEIEQLQGELRKQALHDPLTNLYNRRYLSETLERELKRAQREKKSVSMIIMDLDHFKTINDTYGHQVGDRFLMAIAELLKTHTRGSDIACRYGGEEFLLVLPETTVKSALKRAEQLRLACANIRIPHDGRELSFTISIGVAVHPIHAKTAEELLIKADKALYNSKHRGRNKVTIWEKSQLLEQ